MKRILAFGNSGAGKSTLAKRLSSDGGLVHLDLDTLAFKKHAPTERREVDVSMLEINAFLSKHDSWVIEGGYADLLEQLFDQADEIIFLDLPAQACIKNADNRAWEPHKYESKAAQDKNLDMLRNWILDYYKRDDPFSEKAHNRIFEKFVGDKTRVTSNQ